MVRIEGNKLLIELESTEPVELLEGFNNSICDLVQMLAESDEIYNYAHLFDAMYYLIELQKGLLIDGSQLNKLFGSPLPEKAPD